jgi:hypothetical protein
MESMKCPACRSMNHATSIRCINCGAPLHEDAPPRRPDVAVEPQAVASWTTMVAPKPQRSLSGVILQIFGSVVTVVSLVAVVLYVNGSISIEEAGPLFAIVGALSMIFWFWMLFDAASNGALMWALTIVVFGTVGAL